MFDIKTLIHATFSSPKTKEIPSKIAIRPILIKGEKKYQLSEQRGDKVLHRNVGEEECQRFIESFSSQFKQLLFQTEQADYQLLGGKKLLKKPPSKQLANLEHNRKKQYLLNEAPFLKRLGVSPNKLAQINRFLELVNDSLKGFVKPLRIVDFGCGKAYLTFALYHFLAETYQPQVVGIDRKADVVAFCQNLADQLGYSALTFKVGDVADYAPEGPVDMVVALHACDTATDVALEKAIQWGAKVILVAPCCQHELYGKIASEPLAGILQHGILRERFAAIATDALRADLLEMHGYKTQVLEFIDSEHTPKNIAIRAVLGNSEKRRADAAKRYTTLKSALA